MSETCWMLSSSRCARFDVFEYIVDEIWNIATNPLRSCEFAPYIPYMIEVVTREKFYKDVCST
jgi:hypothetical protein